MTCQGRTTDFATAQCQLTENIEIAAAFRRAAKQPHAVTLGTQRSSPPPTGGFRRGSSALAALTLQETLRERIADCNSVDRPPPSPLLRQTANGESPFFSQRSFLGPESLGDHGERQHELEPVIQQRQGAKTLIPPARHLILCIDGERDTAYFRSNSQGSLSCCQ